MSSQKQTTVKIRCIVDSPNVEADSESGQRPEESSRRRHLCADAASLRCLSSNQANQNRRCNVCDTIRRETGR